MGKLAAITLTHDATRPSRAGLGARLRECAARKAGERADGDTTVMVSRRRSNKKRSQGTGDPI
jgi:hypothetical protein